MRAPASCGLDVIVDGHALAGGSRHRGIGTYLRHLLAGLAARDDLSLTVLGVKQGGVAAGTRAVALYRRPPKRLPSSALRERLADARLERDRGRALARLDGIFHAASHDPPRRAPLPWAQTVQDLTPLVFPHPAMRAEAHRWRRLGNRVRSAAGVIVPSRSTADQVIELLGVPAARVHVIPHGVDPPPPSPTRDAPAREPPFVLLVGAWGPHKGYREASAAIAALARRGLPHRLVIAGGLDPWMLERARADVAAGGGAGRTEIRGYVGDLTSLMRQAEATICPSRAEGFGLPALEAMAAGCPVVAFANSSQTEVVSGGGVLVPDGDTEEMAAVLAAIATDPRERETLRCRGRARAAGFTWAGAVERHVEVYRAVADG